MRLTHVCAIQGLLGDLDQLSSSWHSCSTAFCSRKPRIRAASQRTDSETYGIMEGWASQKRSVISTYDDTVVVCE
jgi:hypothetical protein